jgi:N-6 DNA Methylase
MADQPSDDGLRYVVSVSEIGSLLDANSVSTVSNWRARHADFPVPVTQGHNAQFDVDDVLTWGRRPDTPGRLTGLDSMWWWRKALDAVRVEAVVGAQNHARNPVKSALGAIVLLHAALRGEVQGVRPSARRWDGIVAAPDPAVALADEARRLEQASAQLHRLLERPLAAVEVRPGALRDLLGRLETVAHDGIAPRDRIEAVLERISPAVHRKLDDTTTDDALATFMAEAARVAPGDVIYDPCVGEGGLLLASTRSATVAVTAFAQELDAESSAIARTRFLLEPLECRVGDPGRDSLTEDQFPSEHADVVVCDPPVASRASRSSLGQWLDHVMDHLAGDGRGVVAIPAYALSRVETTRRAPDVRLIERLEELISAGHVRELAVLRADMRRDVPGAMTVWSLMRRPNETRDLVLRLQQDDGSFDVQRWSSPAHDLFAHVGDLSPQMTSPRSQRMRKPREPTPNGAGALLKHLIEDLDPLLSKWGDEEDDEAIDRVRRSLQQLRSVIVD